MKGKFIVLDGLGGLGKTTQIELLKKRLGERAVYTYEPGGTPHAERLRSFVRSVNGPEPHPFMDFFLFFAARADHMYKKILTEIKRGKIVISDRFDSSTFAMQVRGDRNKDLEKLFWQCRELIVKEHEPDAYIVLDGPAKEARLRRTKRREKDDRFDKREDAYQNRIRKGYLEFAKHIDKRAHVVNAIRPREEVHEDIWEIVLRVTKA